MEAVPRLPMMCFELKVSPDRQPTDFSKIKQYIRDFYNEDPESYSGEIHKLEALRATAMRPANDVTGCSALKKYYCQLHFLQSRFPMEKDGAAAVNFTWRDTYANMVCTLADIRFEVVAVLYNIGALHSQLGAGDMRSTSEGLKLACTHLQCAAWAFQHLKDTYPQPSGIDLSPDLMQFMYQVCLAQAQECILEKSMTDNRKATINAKVAAQIVDYYSMALNALSKGETDDVPIQETVGSKRFKHWKRYVKFKQTYYGCISLLYQGQQCEEQQKMGERMAYYQAAFDKLVEATKLTKGLEHPPEVIEEALTFTMDVVEGKRKAAKNENEFIYHEEVPDKDTLPEIKGAALVKGIPFSVNDLDISGPDIFSRLVPMIAHEASSLYSEEKAKLLRRIGAMVDERDQELVGFLSSLQLECVNAHLEPNILPQDIVDRCAALSAKPDAIQQLIESMDKLSDIYHDVDAMLKEIMELIQNEEEEEKEYQEVMGKRPPSIVATDLTREAKKYEEAHNKAAESNNSLHKAMTQHIANLRLLELPLSQLAQQIPSVQSLNLNEQPVVKEMQTLVGKVGEMRNQRAMLATQLRESVCADDITGKLVTTQADNLDSLFQQEMQKHAKYVTFLEQNLAAQENIVRALTETYAQYAPVRKATMELIRQRNLTLTALISSYDAYEDLIAKSNKGQEFYRKLETNVTKLLQRVKGTCKVQQEERDTILATNCKRLPSKVKPMNNGIPQDHSSEMNTPKLKDYLESYKKDKAAFPGQNPGSELYYSSGSSPKPVYPDNVSVPYDPAQSWVPSVRPAPVGQEGTCPATTSQDLKPEPSYPGYSSNYSSNPIKTYTDPSQYPQAYNEQYAAYMNQYSQYPSTSSPYHMPHTNESSTKVPNVASSVNYPASSPSPQMQGVKNYPSPVPSPGGGMYQPTSYDKNTYNAATTLPQGYNPATYSTGQQYTTPSQQYNSAGYSTQGAQPAANYATQNGQNVNYSSQGGQPVTNYPTQSGQPAANYPSQSGQHTANYATQTGQHTANYPSQSGQHTTNYPTQTGQPTANYPTQSGQHSANYTTQTEQPASNYSNQTGLSAAHYTHQNPQPVANYSTQSTTYPLQGQNTSGQEGYPGSVQGLSQLNNTQSQNYQTQNIPQVQDYSNNASPQHGYSTVSQGANYQTPNINQSSSYPSVQAYQTPVATFSQPNISLQQSSGISSQPNSQQTDVITVYSGQTAITYSTNIPSQEAANQGYQYPSNYGYTSQTPSVSQDNQNQQYSSYTPQMYTAYMNNDQYNQGSHSGPQPWQTSYDGKNIPQNYYAQYQNYPQATELQYTPATGASHYTHAGQPTSSVSTARWWALPEGQENQANYTQGNYYSQPYGAHYTSGTVESPSMSPRPLQVSSPQQGSVTPQSPMTYVQASHYDLKLTSSQETMMKGSKATSSNVDLLAGLDFSVSQDVLVPQQKASDSPVKPQLKPVTAVSGLEEKIAAVSIVEKPNPVPTSLPVVASPKKSSGESKRFQLKDPFNDPEVLNQFVQEVEKFDKFVEGLAVKTLNGPTPLDIKWKELLDLQEKDVGRHSISVARCYPVKNRFPDILPYDNSRVELPSTKDDYINASYVKNVTPDFPEFIVTQLPLASTFGDFWTMVLEQQVELVVCLLNDSEMEGSVYWPVERGVEMVVDRVKLTLQSSNPHKHWVERIIHVTDTRLTRVVVHLQFLEWPGSLFPSSPGPFLGLVSEALSVRSEQRGHGPCVVHCLSGVGRSGLFLLAVAAVCHVHAVRTLPDLVILAAHIAAWRKNPLRDREHFKFAYQLLLYYGQDLLMKRGILASRSSFEDKRPKSHTRHPSQDFLLGPPKDVTQPQGSPEKKSSEETSSEVKQEEQMDPLSSLDPLWSLKK